MVVAITVLVTWLIVAHDLWEHALDARGRNRRCCSTRRP